MTYYHQSVVVGPVTSPSKSPVRDLFHVTEHLRQRNTISEQRAGITGSVLLHGFPVVKSELASDPTANKLPCGDKMAVALFGDRAVNVSMFEPRGKQSATTIIWNVSPIYHGDH